MNLVPINKAKRAAVKLSYRFKKADIKFEFTGPVKSGKRKIPYVLVMVQEPLSRAVQSLWGLDIEKREGGRRDLGDTSFVFEGVLFWLAASPLDSWGAAAIHRGPIAFAQLVAERAAQLGYKFSRRGVIFFDEVLAGKTEAQIFDLLEMPFVRHPDRWDRDKVRALRNRLLRKEGRHGSKKD